MGIDLNEIVVGVAAMLLKVYVNNDGVITPEEKRNLAILGETAMKLSKDITSDEYKKLKRLSESLD